MTLEAIKSEIAGEISRHAERMNSLDRELRRIEAGEEPAEWQPTVIDDPDLESAASQ